MSGPSTPKRMAYRSDQDDLSQLAGAVGPTKEETWESGTLE